MRLETAYSPENDDEKPTLTVDFYELFAKYRILARLPRYL